MNQLEHRPRVRISVPWRFEPDMPKSSLQQLHMSRPSTRDAETSPLAQCHSLDWKSSPGSEFGFKGINAFSTGTNSSAGIIGAAHTFSRTINCIALCAQTVGEARKDQYAKRIASWIWSCDVIWIPNNKLNLLKMTHCPYVISRTSDMHFQFAM